ncbi:SIMPL domain-containing protein [Desulfonatronovibrio magnus]|uniref:SIMPL domain-containing protein n=1 Tax=Desulfonatronovibrio magnus TaxID=698827 RepID=UPI0005EAEC72|nr:SIMPL domain-containing protein [Desulfonatronovibrio magnus]
MDNRASNNFMASIIVSLAIVTAALVLSSGIEDFRSYDRYVSVRGFAEREVQADLAYWPISFSAAGNNLQSIQLELDASAEAVFDFLESQGLGGAEVSVSAPRITDQHTFGFAEHQQPANRFTAQSVITVRTNDAAAVKNAMSAAGELVSKGVVLIHSYEFQPIFEYTGLAEIKPEMIAQATQDARQAAQQFARDSGSTVGAIRRASQGLFTINDRDPFTPEIKSVRVVTSVDYFLEE